jgi:FkbM family methyltransferase
MPGLSRFPIVMSIHRALVSLIQRSGRSGGRFFGLYRRVWLVLGRYQQARTRFGAVVECDLRDLVPSYIFHFGHWEPNISYWMARRLCPGDLFVDIGANVGYYSLLASSVVGESGGVVAIEASPSIYMKLNRSIEANQCKNVRVVNVAVSNRPGHVTIYSGPPENRSATSTLQDWRGGKPEAKVVALPLDQILTEGELQRVRLIKIDVEGAEPAILRQIAETIQRYPRGIEILVECTLKDNSQEWDVIFAVLFSAGFSAYAIENEYSTAWYLRWRFPSDLQPLSSLPSGQTDVLFTRDEHCRTTGLVEVDVAVDPSELPAMPHVKIEQAWRFGIGEIRELIGQ